MEGVLEYSKLNPLASCFVPLNIKIVLQDVRSCTPEIDSCEPKPNELKLDFIVEIKAKRSRRIPKRDIFAKKSSRWNILGMTQCAVKLLNENFYFSGKYCDTKSESVVAYRYFLSELNEMILKFLFLILLGMPTIKERFGHPTQWTDKKENLSLGAAEAEESCTCPPMFGCIVPPDFFGNPFNLKSSCNKKNVHVCHYSKANGNDALSQPLQKKAETAASFGSGEQIGNEGGHLKGLASCTSTTCVGETRGSLKADLGASGASSENKAVNLEVLSSTEVPKAEPPDDFHLLLAKGIWTKPSEGTFIAENDALKTKLLAEHPSRKLPFDPHEVSCNPPCSVWCDSVPRTAQETHRKHARSMPLSWGSVRNFSKPGHAKRFDPFAPVRWSSAEQNIFYGGLGARKVGSLRVVKEIKFNAAGGYPFAPRATEAAGNNSVGCEESMRKIVDSKDSLWQALPGSPVSRPRDSKF